MAPSAPPAPATRGRLHGSVPVIIGATPLVRPGHSTRVEPAPDNTGIERRRTARLPGAEAELTPARRGALSADLLAGP